MIVVAIIGILAAIAYPSYRDYVIRGALVDATNGLSTTRADMERHLQDNRTYASVGFTSPCLRAGGIAFGDFTITCSVAPTAAGYTLSAAGNPGTNVAGFTFTVDQIDQRTTVAPTGWPKLQPALAHEEGALCWRRPMSPARHDDRRADGDDQHLGLVVVPGRARTSARGS